MIALGLLLAWFGGGLALGAWLNGRRRRRLHEPRALKLLERPRPCTTCGWSTACHACDNGDRRPSDPPGYVRPPPTSMPGPGESRLG